MHYTDPLTVEKLAALRGEAARRQAQSDELRREAATMQRQDLSHRSRNLLAHLGQQLVVVGSRLEQYGNPRPSY